MSITLYDAAHRNKWTNMVVHLSDTFSTSIYQLILTTYITRTVFVSFRAGCTLLSGFPQSQRNRRKSIREAHGAPRKPWYTCRTKPQKPKDGVKSRSAKKIAALIFPPFQPANHAFMALQRYAYSVLPPRIIRFMVPQSIFRCG